MSLKTIGLLIFTLGYLPYSFGQNNNPIDLAQKHIKMSANKWGLKSDDYQGMVISSEATSETGIKYIYLQQTYKNIPIRNATMTLILDKDGNVVSDAHNLVSEVKDKINSSVAGISAIQAIVSSAGHFNINLNDKPTSSTRSDGGKYSFILSEMTKSPIEAELKYELTGDKLILVWNLQLDMVNSSDYWDININALTGAFVSKSNYTTYCTIPRYAFSDSGHSGHSLIENTDKTLKYPQDILLGAAARYNVYKLPVESPKHGPRTFATDGQYPTASPFGWHDTNGVDGAEFTITRGNNVHAFEDKNDDNQSDGNEPNGGSALSFDFPIDLNNDPRQNNLAAVTNLFYLTNMMHDVSFTTGFTEEFGNFQQKNYTGKGDGNDYVQAQAFDGITLHEAKLDVVDGVAQKINNANFSSPVDGFSGRMQMFLWDNDGGSVSIDAPENIKGFISEYGGAGFGQPIPNSTESPISGNVAIAKDGSSNPTALCDNAINPGEIKGKIAMVDRGLCDFSKKVFNAQQAGAIAVIVCNIAGVNGGNGEELLTMGAAANAGSVTIPSVFLKKSDCEKIRIVLVAGGNVTMTFQQRERQGAAYIDGSLDNGIIAHEYAHGISNRLTGGRLSSSCLTNDEQMGEGWSDFFALVMTHKPGDSGKEAKGIGTFAAAQEITGGGFRRYPYSTDMNINPQTFNSIKGTKRADSPCNGCHSLGEIWADVLWDMYWAFIDKYGYDADWKNKNSGNYKAVFLVIEGMKVQPCNPGFIQARDAILKADEINNGYINKCLLWNVFARRGLGYFANGGSKDDRDDGNENFDPLPTCIEKLKIDKIVSASVNPGGDVDVELKATNHIPAKQNNVFVTDDLPDGLTYISGSSSIVPLVSGNKLIFQVGDMDYEKEVKISYKVRASKDNKSVRMAIQNFDSDFNWEIDKNVGNEYWLPNNDIYQSPFTSLNIINIDSESDAFLISDKYVITGKNPVARFWHRYNTQYGNDAGFVEISLNGGLFIPVKKEKFIRNGYTGPMAYTTLAIPSLDAFSGNSGGSWTKANMVGPWIDSYIDLSEYIGKSIIFRFRFGSDPTVKAAGDFTGWFVDDFELLDIYKYTSEACVAADGGQGDKSCTQAMQTLVNSLESVNPSQDVQVDFFDVSVSPNPANDYVIIKASAPMPVITSVNILNTEGKSIRQSYLHLDNIQRVNALDINGIAPGFYIVKLQAGNYIKTIKLMIY